MSESGRPMSGSRSHMNSSINAGLSNSRPFLNMLNPTGRKYHGYAQANQSVLEEEEDEGREEELHDTTQPSQSVAGTSRSPPGRRISWGAARASTASALHPNIHQQDGVQGGNESSDDEVPQSFIVEPTVTRKPSSRRSKGRTRDRDSMPHKAPAPLLPAAPDVATRVSIPPRPFELDPEEARGPAPQQNRQMRGLDAYERALWNWVNVYNLDAFLQEVYYYYEGKGIYCIALSRILNLLTVGFVIGFSTFLLGCVDYSLIRHDARLSDVVVPRCVSRFSGFALLFFLLFSAFYLWQIITFVLGIRKLIDMYNFYTYLLRIPDADIPTISWPEVVRRLAAIREENPMTAISSTASGAPHNATATAKLDAHDVANRIMRQENYLISLFNKELLDLRAPLPGPLSRFVAPEEGKGRPLTRALEWNLRFCLMEYLFDPNGKVRKVFLKSKNRAVLIEGLRRRLIFMGILNAIFAPFIVLYLLMYSFFRYFEEYHKNPSSIGGRRYTPFALWKFREFNELPHLFSRRLDESHPIANVYIAQFPNEKLALIMRFVAFVAGSFAAVLVLFSVLDPDLSVHFEITPHRSVLFYVAVFGSIMATARGMVPEEHRVFDPEELMAEVVQFTHYMPDSWKSELHSKKVHQEFGELFILKVMIFAQELLGVVLTPFVLWFSLPRCAPAIVDFFREFTVHVDGLGYVCSFAVFDFQRHGNVKFGAPTQVKDEKFISKEGKMEKSFLNFKAAHPDWNPTDPSGSLYLSRMADYSARPTHNTPTKRQQVWTRGGGSYLADTTVLSDKAHEYDRALRESQTAAARRRRTGLGASTLLGAGGASMMVGQYPPEASVVFAPGMAQTAVLGDSAGSEVLAPAPMPTQSNVKDIRPEDVTPDNGVGSGLGESYVDGRRAATEQPAGLSITQSIQEEEELEDGGVLGLLAQIYGTKGRAQGPARGL